MTDRTAEIIPAQELQSVIDIKQAAHTRLVWPQDVNGRLADEIRRAAVASTRKS